MSAPVIVSEPDRESIRAVLRKRDLRNWRAALDRATQRIRDRVGVLPYRAITFRVAGTATCGEGALSDEHCRDRAREVCARHGTSFETLAGISRARDVVCLQGEVWLQLIDDGFAFIAIARVFGRHHSTVMHSVKRARARRGEG